MEILYVLEPCLGGELEVFLIADHLLIFWRKACCTEMPPWMTYWISPPRILALLHFSNYASPQLSMVHSRTRNEVSRQTQKESDMVLQGLNLHTQKAQIGMYL